MRGCVKQGNAGLTGETRLHVAAVSLDPPLPVLPVSGPLSLSVTPCPDTLHLRKCIVRAKRRTPQGGASCLRDEDCARTGVDILLALEYNSPVMQAYEYTAGELACQ
mgnify:CR=1 FL=1